MTSVVSASFFRGWYARRVPEELFGSGLSTLLALRRLELGPPDHESWLLDHVLVAKSESDATVLLRPQVLDHAVDDVLEPAHMRRFDIFQPDDQVAQLLTSLDDLDNFPYKVENMAPSANPSANLKALHMLLKLRVQLERALEDVESAIQITPVHYPDRLL